MKSLIKIFLTLSLVYSFAFAIKKEDIQSVMTSKINNVLSILEKKDLTNTQKGDEIIKIIDEVFDYNLMAMISLGKQTWMSITPEQRVEFTKVFEEKLKKSYIEKLEFYNDQKVKILGLEEYKGSRQQLQTELVGAAETYQINYNFYSKKGDWLIYDVDLVGVSIIKTYQTQFDGQLKEKSFDVMLQEMKDSLTQTTKK